jgi:hypothetical protein
MVMATQLLPEQLHDACSHLRVHWVCVEVQDHPFIGLCGQLTDGLRLGEHPQMCRRCVELSHSHAAVCASCAEWVGRA